MYRKGTNKTKKTPKRDTQASARGLRKSAGRLTENLPLDVLVALSLMLPSRTHMFGGATHAACMDELAQRELTEQEWRYVKGRLT